MYVKGHSNEERCRLAVDFRETGVEEINFKVLFGTCGLFHNAVSKPLYSTVGRVSVFFGSFRIFFYFDVFFSYFILVPAEGSTSPGPSSCGALIILSNLT